MYCGFVSFQLCCHLESLVDHAKAIFSLLVGCGRGGISNSFLKPFKNAFGPKRQPTQDAYSEFE